MRKILIIVGLAVAAMNASATSARVILKAADGSSVFGDASPANGRERAVLLLFHQAGSSAAEYAHIAPKLNALGFSTLAIDQRSGGDLYGPNATVAARGGRDASYAAALPDLEAALAYAKSQQPARPIVVVGSSYSAALVFVLAKRHPQDISAVAAFSPGEYISGENIAADAASVSAPIFVDSAADASEIAAAATILKNAPAAIKVQYRPKAGIHGASTLRTDRAPRGAGDNFKAFTEFLAKVIP